MAQQARRLNGEPGGQVRVAFQGAAHAYSDAAAQKYLAGRGLDGDLTGYRTFREAADALLAGRGRPRRAADREHHRRQHQRGLRAAARARAVHRRRGDLEGRPLPGRGPGRAAVRAEPDPVPSAGARAVLAVPAVAAEGHPDQLLRHRRGDARGGRGRRSEPSPRSARPTRPPGLRAGRAAAQHLGLRTTTTPGSWCCPAPRPRRPAHPVQDQPHPGHRARGGRPAALPGGAVGQRPLDDQAGVAARGPAGRGSTCSSSTSRATPPTPGPPPRWTNCAAAALYVKILGSYPAKALRAPARPGGLPARCDGRCTRPQPRPPSRIRPRCWRPWPPRPEPGRPAGPGTTSSSTGPPGQDDTVIAVGDLLDRRGRLRGHGRAVLGGERGADHRDGPVRAASTARRCCAAACSSRGPRRTRSRAWAGRAWTCWSPPGGRPACRSSPR